VAASENRVGLAYGLAAYVFWGVMPAFWKTLASVPASEILAHRVPWALLSFAVIARWRGRLGEVRAVLANGRLRATLCLSALLLAINWLTFVYAVVTGRVLQASLGYFINPLVSVLLGLVVLRERLRRAQWIAVALAAAGVAQLAAGVDDGIWIGLVLAVTFGLYGLIRKTARVDALPGSTSEMIVLAPIALAFLALLAGRGAGEFGHGDAVTHVLLVASGPLTALPLLWFTNAARRLPLSTLGFIQYLAPSLQLGLAVLAFGEPFTSVHARSFGCIWIALAVFTADRVRALRTARSINAAAGDRHR
jgi:chloramphenicol-sensitive protein RarD